MPELPEVETIRRGLSIPLSNRIFQKIVIRQNKLRWPITKSLAQILVQKKIIKVSRRSKYLLLRTSTGTLMIHLGMSGSLRLHSQLPPAQKHDHVDFIFDTIALRYTDPRRFGAILWTGHEIEQHPLLTSLGPEPLSKNFNANYLLAASRQRKVAIKNFIMNNKVVVGVGNIYATEALFSAGILPTRSADSLTADESDALCQSIKQILTKAIKAGGTTLKDFSKSDGKPGYFSQQLLVYGRAGQACTQCHKTLEKVILGQRSSVFCTQCQS